MPPTDRPRRASSTLRSLVQLGWKYRWAALLLLLFFSLPAFPEKYWVKKGDTLETIANRFKTTIAAIMAANPTIKDPNDIHEGQALTLHNPLPLPAPEAGSTYTVIEGDTLISIAARFDCEVSDLMILNQYTIKDADKIRAGAEIITPAGQASSPHSPPQKNKKRKAPLAVNDFGDPVANLTRSDPVHTLGSSFGQASLNLADLPTSKHATQPHHVRTRPTGNGLQTTRRGICMRPDVQSIVKVVR